MKKVKKQPNSIIAKSDDMDFNGTRITVTKLYQASSCTTCGKQWKYNDNQKLALKHAQETGHRVYSKSDIEIIYNWDGIRR